ncbi:MAG: DUF350 domain-containing protein [bacterium]|nr:DUF350 domain-containing protein [bacterium]
MKTKWLTLTVAAAAIFVPAAAFAQEAGGPRIGVGTGLILSIVYGLVGILLLMIGFKIFEWITPFSVDDELKNQNTAVGLAVGAMFIAIAVIIAAALS